MVRRNNAALALILLAVAALVIFLFLLRQWQAPLAQQTKPTTVNDESSAQLEMSRRLTQTGRAVVVSDNASQRTLALPLIAFTLALGAGACLGRWWPTPTREDDGPDTVVADEPEAMATPEAAEPIVADVTVQPEPARSIDALPRDEAMLAKDQVIESLEGIVNENRERWSDFEAERDALSEKIEKLQEELRIASDIIDGTPGDALSEPLVPPQIVRRA